MKTYVYRSMGMLCLMLCLSASAKQGNLVFEIHLRDHLFYPSTVTIPAGKKIKLIIYNHDKTPEEFDSFQLNREKVVFAGGKASVYIGPLNPGSYPFVGEFNPNTARGELVVKVEQVKPDAD